MQNPIHHRSRGDDDEAALTTAPATTFQIGEAHQVNISGGSFPTVQGNYYNVKHHGTGIQILFQHIAENALHDASERYPAPNCHPGTREDVLQTIKTWIGDEDSETRLLWLSGKVGVGKSAIMQKIVEELLGKDPNNHPVAASFFFGRGKGKRALGKYLFPTLAYQLALNIPELHGSMDHIMQSDPSLPTRSINTQFQSLIINPFLECQGNITPRVIIIDGLDECEGDEIQQLIIKLIGTAWNDHHSPLRFVIASRPECQICDALDMPAIFQGLHTVVLDNFSSSKDIEKFLREQFSEIYQRKAHLMQDVSPLWPGQYVILQIVKRAEGQFIYASTIVKFTDSKFTSPAKQLEIALCPNHQSHVLSPLDNLYTEILSAHPDSEILVAVLGYLVIHEVVYKSELQFFLGLDSSDTDIAAQALQSVLDIGGSLEVIELAHASFSDYLTDHKRSGKYFIDKSVHEVKSTVHAFSSISSTISKRFQMSQQQDHIVNAGDEKHIDLICYRRLRSGYKIDDSVVVESLFSISKCFASSITSITLSSIPLALDISTYELLYPLNLIHTVLGGYMFEPIGDEIRLPYQLLLDRCLDILSHLPGSLHDLVLFAPRIVGIPGNDNGMHIDFLSHLLGVGELQLQHFLKKNYIFFFPQDDEYVDDANLGSLEKAVFDGESFFGLSERASALAATTILGACCFISVRLGFLDWLCSKVLQSDWRSVDFIRFAEGLEQNQYADVRLRDVLDNVGDSVGEDLQNCSKGQLHLQEFYTNLKSPTQCLLPQAPVLVIQCVMDLFYFIVSPLGQKPAEEYPSDTFKCEIFSQVFQLSSSQGRNIITLQQPFLAYYRMMATNRHFPCPSHLGFNELYSADPPIDCDLPFQLSADLFAMNSFLYQKFLISFLQSASKSSHSAPVSKESDVKQAYNIIQWVENTKMPTTMDDPELLDAIKRNYDRVLEFFRKRLC